MLNRALNIPGFSRCVAENDSSLSNDVAIYYIFCSSMYYIINFIYFFDQLLFQSVQLYRIYIRIIFYIQYILLNQK